MKHLTYAEKSLLVGDEAAGLLLEYAAALTRSSSGDTVEVKAVGADGADVVATFLLGAGSPLMVESSDSSMVEPDNSAAEVYLRDHLRILNAHPQGLPVGQADLAQLEEDFLDD
ncbi:hypothetical protein WDJ51_11580 [Rathayibacter sp. YIM 133350]|uniref:hypothetical protein n=1 Tax=Rathayibacter sp. YIM 133350 TaxID=3131992 RepID=UPI00307D6D75